MFKKIAPIVLKTSLFCIGLLGIMGGLAHAQGALGGDWGQYLGGLRNFRETEGVAGEDLIIAFVRNAIQIVKYIVGALAALFGIIYAMAFVMAGDKEDTVTKQKKNFVAILIAFILLLIGDGVADILTPDKSTATQLIDFEASEDLLRTVTNYFKWLMGSIAVLMMTISGFRIIAAQGEEEKLTKQKKNLLWSGMGLMIILLATGAVNAIYVIEEETREVAPGTTQAITDEIAGVIRLVLVLLGPLAVLFTIYAGFLYVTSLNNEERITKAKTMLVAGVTGIVIIYLAYALVNTVIQANLVPEAARLPFFFT